MSTPRSSTPDEDPLELNRAHWDARVPAHVASPDYAVERMVAEPDRISDVVAYDRDRMGDVSGLDLVHLQCHIGTDTLSWARLGAQVTGLDFSGPAVEAARELADRLGLDATFVQGDVHDAPALLGGATFDVVFTGIGALCWLPDVRRWAEVVAALLRPGGRLFLREGHPALWALAYDRDDDLLVLDEHWFEVPGGLREEPDGTYVEVADDVDLSDLPVYSYNHGLGEILSAVLEVGLVIERFEEHREAPWPPTERFERSTEHPGEWVLPAHQRDLLPLTYTLVARRPDAPAAAG